MKMISGVLIELYLEAFEKSMSNIKEQFYKKHIR